MDQKKIGKYITNKRKSQGLTQAQLADKLGVGDKAVSKWERGISLPDVSKYQELCNILEISLNEFFAGEDLQTESVILQSEQNIIEITNDNERRRRRGKQLITVLSVVILVLILITSANIRNYHSLLVRDYDIVSWAFSLAVNDIDESELSDREILLELGDDAFHAVGQTRGIKSSVLIGSRWYSDNLYNFLFSCVAANDLSDEEVDTLIARVPAISEELKKNDWEAFWIEGTTMWHLNEIFDVIETADGIAVLP